MPTDPKDMTVEAMQAEMKTLAVQQRPIAARRSALAKEMKARKKKAIIDSRASGLNQQGKEALYFTLKEELGK